MGRHILTVRLAHEQERMEVEFIYRILPAFTHMGLFTSLKEQIISGRQMAALHHQADSTDQ